MYRHITILICMGLPCPEFTPNSESSQVRLRRYYWRNYSGKVICHRDTKKQGCTITIIVTLDGKENNEIRERHEKQGK